MVSERVDARDPRDEKIMPFLHHLEELRQTLIRVIVAVAVGGVLAWNVSGRVLSWLIANTTGTAIFFKPQGAFMARFKVSLVLGVLLSLPYVFYKIWSFVGPGLLERERKVVLPGALSSVLLFYTGICFSYLVMTPVMVKVLIGFGTANLVANTDISFLLDLVFAMGLACGLIFQLPLFAAFLTSIGLLNPRLIRRYWRHSIVAIFIAAAVLTPADPMSQILLAIPLLILFAVSWILSSMIYRSKRAGRAAAADAAADDQAPSGPGGPPRGPAGNEPPAGPVPREPAPPAAGGPGAGSAPDGHPSAEVRPAPEDGPAPPRDA